MGANDSVAPDAQKNPSKRIATRGYRSRARCMLSARGRSVKRAPFSGGGGRGYAIQIGGRRIVEEPSRKIGLSRTTETQTGRSSSEMPQSQTRGLVAAADLEHH